MLCTLMHWLYGRRTCTQGKGHLRGVVHALMRDQGTLRFRDLAGGRRSKPQPAAIARRIAAEAALAVGLGMAWIHMKG